jgi:hypothetical protein
VKKDEENDNVPMENMGSDASIILGWHYKREYSLIIISGIHYMIIEVY